MSIHSKFLVHWTGKDLGIPTKGRPLSSQERQQYLDRLVNYYKKGLFAKKTEEPTIRGRKIKRLVRFCFTEIRLSQVESHAGRYGRLGIGVTREFIMKRGGRPVIYVPYEAGPDGRLLEDSIKTVDEKSKGDNNREIHSAAQWIMAHVKRMSDEKGEDYFEEMEWRLVRHESNKRHFTKEGDGSYRLKFEPSDIKVMIFPDEGLKEMSLRDPRMTGYFADHIPIMATLEDCGHF